MKEHTLTFTDDELTILIALYHVGAASVAGDVGDYLHALQLLWSVEDKNEKIAMSIQEKLLKASDPASWDHALNVLAAKERRN